MTVGIIAALLGRETSAEEWSRKQVRDLEASLVGRTYYLLAPAIPLLGNDAVRIEGCKIRPIRDDLRPRSRFEVEVEVRGVSGAPPAAVSLDVGRLSHPDELEAHLASHLSVVPLETLRDWPEIVQCAVRARVLLLGMNPEMVDLVLGRLPKRVDRELLDDGRVREVWKLQIMDDTRRVFRRQSTWSMTIGALQESSRSNVAVGSASTSAAGTTNAFMFSAGSGVEIFSGLPPEFLHIEFTDGKVTAHKTEFVK